jgi:hypothetical protein
VFGGADERLALDGIVAVYPEVAAQYLGVTVRVAVDSGRRHR